MLAYAIGAAVKSVQRWESGQTVPSVPHAVLLMTLCAAVELDGAPTVTRVFDRMFDLGPESMAAASGGDGFTRSRAWRYVCRLGGSSVGADASEHTRLGRLRRSLAAIVDAGPGKLATWPERVAPDTQNLAS